MRSVEDESILAKILESADWNSEYIKSIDGDSYWGSATVGYDNAISFYKALEEGKPLDLAGGDVFIFKSEGNYNVVATCNLNNITAIPFSDICCMVLISANDVGRVSSFETMQELGYIV